MIEKTKFNPNFGVSKPDTFEKSEPEIPAEYVSLFESIKNLEGKPFLKTAYTSLVHILGVQDVAKPKMNFAFFNWGVPAVTKAATDPMDGSLTVYKGIYTEPNKWEQLGDIAHEVYHLKQYTDILRHEDITPDDYIDTMTDYCFSSAPYLNKTELRNNISAKSAQFLKNTSKLPKIKADTKEGEHSIALFEALKNYPHSISSSLDDYKNNLLEKEAYAFQDQIVELAEKYFNLNQN